MIDHVVLPVSNYEKSKAFYTKVLAPLGYGLLFEPMPKMGGFGRDGKPSFWIGERRPGYWSEANQVGAAPVHVAFVAPGRAAVEAFFQAALEGGGQDYGKPGLRPHYHASYYGAFILDPDGNNIEAVTHKPE